MNDIELLNNTDVSVMFTAKQAVFAVCFFVYIGGLTVVDLMEYPSSISWI
jgi:hypothetical protein